MRLFLLLLSLMHTVGVLLKHLEHEQSSILLWILFLCGNGLLIDVQYLQNFRQPQIVYVQS
jgi:hypothetical protein